MKSPYEAVQYHLEAEAHHITQENYIDACYEGPNSQDWMKRHHEQAEDHEARLTYYRERWPEEYERAESDLQAKWEAES